MISAQTNMKKLLNASETYYEIPNFQRPYSWQKVNAEDFLEDLEESVAKKKNHYFGTVVQIEDTASSYSVAIIDGQQRVTTSLLMVTAIYHLVKKDPSLIEDPETTSELIRNRYLFNANIDKNKVKLRTVTTDNEILQHIFDKEGEEDRLSQKDRLSNLYQMYSTFRKYFSTKKALDRYVEGLSYFEVISITLNANDDNPQRVFESINSTGKPLTDGDKIRNFALMLNNDKTRDYVYKKYWSLIEESLVDVNKDNITDFFRSYIISKKASIVKLDAVYPEFKKLFYKQVDDSQEISLLDTFYSEVVEFLGFYKLLKLDEVGNFNERYKAIAENIFRMRYLQIDIYIPFAMNVLRYHADGNISNDQMAEIFKVIEIYFSRRIVCNIATTSTDKFFASLHKDALDHLRTSPDAGYTEIVKYLFLNRTGPTSLPSDSEYEKAIRTNETYRQRNSFITYILTSTEGSSKEAKTLHHIIEKRLNLSIEHVMPQTLTRSWEKELGLEKLGVERVHEIHSQYLHTLANLTLTGYNSEYSNRSFSEKMTLEVKGEKVGFADSDLRINKWIASQIRWDEQTLQSRQDWWVQNLRKTWPMPSSSFVSVEPDTMVYLLDELDLKGKGIRAVEVFGYKTSAVSWAEALDIIAEALYEKYPEFISTVTNDEFLSRFIKNDSSAFNNSAEIMETGYYIFTGINTNRKLKLISELGKAFDLTRDDIKAELTVADTDNSEEE